MLGFFYAHGALTARGDDERERNLKLAVDAFKNIDPFYANATQDLIGLEKLQKDYEANLNEPFVGLSVTETLHKLLALSTFASSTFFSLLSEEYGRAEGLKKSRQIPEARYTWVYMKALGASSTFSSSC